MMPKNTPLFVVLLSLTLSAIVALGVYGVYRIGAEDRSVAELLKSADESAGKLTLFQSVRALQSNAGADIAAFERLALTNETLVPMIETIENVGRSLGLETKIISVDKVAKGKDASALGGFRVAVESDGGWSGSLAFLKALESLPYRVNFEETSYLKGASGWHSRIVIFLPSFE